MFRPAFLLLCFFYIFLVGGASAEVKSGDTHVSLEQLISDSSPSDTEVEQISDLPKKLSVLEEKSASEEKNLPKSSKKGRTVVLPLLEALPVGPFEKSLIHFLGKALIGLERQIRTNPKAAQEIVATVTR